MSRPERPAASAPPPGTPPAPYGPNEEPLPPASAAAAALGWMALCYGVAAYARVTAFAGRVLQALVEAGLRLPPALEVAQLFDKELGRRLPQRAFTATTLRRAGSHIVGPLGLARCVPVSACGSSPGLLTTVVS